MDRRQVRRRRGAAQCMAFVRTSIELLEHFFAPGEVAEIWITFPDPQMKKATKRLTGTRMVELYRRVLAPGAMVHLKTDSPFLYAYTEMMCRHNGLANQVRRCRYRCPAHVPADRCLPSAHTTRPVARPRTHHPLSRFRCRRQRIAQRASGAEELDRDTYRSYSRGYIQMPGLMNQNND